jgi:septal ring factor EnvC (AmiA/AmiB activator)
LRRQDKQIKQRLELRRKRLRAGLAELERAIEETRKELDNIERTMVGLKGRRKRT